MSYSCIYCLANLEEQVLDFSRDIICGTCTQKLIGFSTPPKKKPSKRKIKRLKMEEVK